MSRLLHEYRRLRGRLLNRADPMVLMYHRIDVVPCDPWHLAVHPERLGEQLDVLTRHRAVVPLGWLVGELTAGRMPENVACLTFDDGYVDVLRNARSVLDRFNAPATVFLTSGAIGRRCEFWWDTLSRILLQTEYLPEELTIDLAGARRSWRIGSTAEAGVDREGLHFDVWSTLRDLSQIVRDEVLAALQEWAGHAPAPGPNDRAMDAEEVVELFDPGFIDIGSHGVTHSSLPLLSDQEKRAELVESRETCAAICGQAIESFAYPFGDYDLSTERLVRDCGYSHACTAEPRAALSARDRFRLPRVSVRDWTGEDFETRLRTARAAFLEAT